MLNKSFITFIGNHKKQLRSLKKSLTQHKKRLEKANSKMEDYQDAYNVYVEEFIHKYGREKLDRIIHEARTIGQVPYMPKGIKF